IPATFVMLEMMPLTPNGKIDRKSLPAPDSVRPEPTGNFVAPRNPVEEALATVWCDVLGLEKVGAEDNFFELGGHSLLATQLISRLRETFKMEIPLRCLFESPTIGKLSQSMVGYEAKPGVLERTSKILNKLSRMTPEEMEQALRKRRPANAQV
ncbi:MAG: amino acid adenylation domain protein, partial [Pedosphaera sp.]|nr:amino acid adenylation domain protein [Pedosphaera sp.]